LHEEQTGAVELVGERVVLRPIVASDVEDLVAMFAEPDVARWWPRFDRAKIDKELLHAADAVVYTITVDGVVAGVIQSWEEDDPDYRHAGLDIAVATRWHGRGIAVDSLRTLARHLVHGEGHHRLVIDPALANERAIACYRKAGFKPVGVMRKYERGVDGTFHDSLLMDLLEEELP
jgi:aminoglycoside 6'-N-acetyltransferase